MYNSISALVFLVLGIFSWDDNVSFFGYMILVNILLGIEEIKREIRNSKKV